MNNIGDDDNATALLHTRQTSFRVQSHAHRRLFNNTASELMCAHLTHTHTHSIQTQHCHLDSGDNTLLSNNTLQTTHNGRSAYAYTLP